MHDCDQIMGGQFQSQSFTIYPLPADSNTGLYIQGPGGGGGGGGAKVSGHTFGLIPPSCFILEGCCFADGILYLNVPSDLKKMQNRLEMTKLSSI